MTPRTYKMLVLFGKTVMLLGMLVYALLSLPLAILMGPPLALLSVLGALWPRKTGRRSASQDGGADHASAGLDPRCARPGAPGRRTDARFRLHDAGDGRDFGARSPGPLALGPLIPPRSVWAFLIAGRRAAVFHRGRSVFLDPRPAICA